jgi:hypothetical protein
VCVKECRAFESAREGGFYIYIRRGREKSEDNARESAAWITYNVVVNE